MGLPNKYLYATNTGEDEIFLSAWKPIKKEGGYCWNPEASIGNEMWIPNVLGLTEEEGTVPVKIIRSQEETGIWIICYDDYFGGEKHIYVYKPKFLEGTTRLDYNYSEDLRDTDDIFGIHVTSSFDMNSGEGPWPVTFVRGDNYAEPEKKNIKVAQFYKTIIQKKEKRELTLFFYFSQFSIFNITGIVVCIRYINFFILNYNCFSRFRD